MTTRSWNTTPNAGPPTAPARLRSCSRTRSLCRSRSRTRAAGPPSHPADAIIEGIETVARQHAHQREDGNASVMQAALGSVDKSRSDARLPLPRDAPASRRRDLCARRGRQGPLHRSPGAGSQGAALPHQRQIRGDTRGRARRPRADGCWALASSFSLAPSSVSDRPIGWQQTGFSVEAPKDILQNETWW